ncbi:MAG: MFS transporter [Chloroflexi bacterium]|nr:MFS transporter [Chloroflexota bacterium]
MKKAKRSTAVRASDASASKSIALFISCAAAFLTPFMVSSLNVALPSIGKEFAMSAVLLSWVPTGYLLASAIFLVPFGRLSDIHGRKKVFLWGSVVYTVACLLLPFSTSGDMLIAFRVLEGVGSAALFGTGAAILTSIFPPGERGKALGIYIGCVYAGLSLGPLIGGALTQSPLTWRSIFFINVLIGIVVIAAVAWKLKGEWAEAKGEAFDTTGSVAYGVSLAALILGLSFLPSLAAAVPVVLGVAGLLFFVRWELNAKSPVLDMRLFRQNPVFAWSSLAALVNYSATAGVGFLLSLYLQYVKGFTPQLAGLVLIAQPVVMTALSPVAGRLSDRTEPQVVASIGMALTTAGLVLLIFLSETTRLWVVVLALLVLGAGFGLFSSPNTNAMMSSVEKRFLGVASGTVGTMRLLGQMLSLAIALMLFSLFIGRVQITPSAFPAFLTCIRVAFTVFAVLCFAGVFASLSRGKMHRHPVEETVERARGQ